MIYLSDNLRYLRKKQGISQQQLADEIETPRSRIAAYESKNVEPRLEALLSFASYFQVSLDELVRIDLRQTDLRKSEEQSISTEALREKCSKLERLIHTRAQRLEFMWQEQEKLNPAVQAAIRELEAFQLLSKQAIQLCKTALD
jgi:transcriptional regulator with XRE-family HTH domain